MKKIKHGNKYNVEQRKVAQRIWDFKKLRGKAYKRWHKYDMLINILERKLEKLMDDKYKKKQVTLI